MWNPEDYAKNSDAQLKWAQQLRKNLDLEKYKFILDVGCGDGKITADFAATLPSSKVLGVDSSPEMIAYANKKYPTSQYPNLSFSCIDARSLNFKQEFDLIFSNATLHWIDDRLAFLKSANSALRDGGRLIISCGGEGNAAEILETFAELIATDAWKAYFNDFHNPYFFSGIQDYNTWLEQSGFAIAKPGLRPIARVELVPKDMIHQGKAGLAGWIRTTWMPFTRCVPEDKRDDFIEEFVNLYLSKNPLDSQGLTHVSMVRLEVDAYVNTEKVFSN